MFLALASAFAITQALEGDAPLSALQQDVEQVCALVPEHYAYFESRAAHWDAACDLARAEAAQSEGAYVLAVLEGLIDALYDTHINLNTNNQTSPWLIPSGSQIRVAEQADGQVVVTDVRTGSRAEGLDIRPGDLVLTINGQAPVDAALRRMRTGDTDLPARRDWALNAAVTGFRHEERRLQLERDGEVFEATLSGFPARRTGTPVSYRMHAPGVGLIRINNSLGRDETVAAFNAALAELGDINSLILDLRDTPGGGNTSVAEPILGRFVQTRTAYQRIEPTDAPAWIRHVDPAAPYSDVALTVRVGGWTGSMGEGMAIGLDAMGRAEVVGPPMAGLAGGTEGFHLPGGDLMLWMPTYNLAHLDGTPRHEWVPPALGD
ncbi:S41 family peptidase [Maricaulis sp.]|uniref:S41 family peptidase n=1 Tax=unclassified Maricaulis TaxID=2632371 RepID=UPI001B2C83A4|nr:S41 family peptidase [Maricaulis sp.]MBO6797529.1 hypothetical protein [Maricaulis sp.]